MTYILEYFDKIKNKTIIESLEADTDKKAIKQVNVILKDKKYNSPGLYDRLEYEKGEVTCSSLCK